MHVPSHVCCLSTESQTGFGCEYVGWKCSLSCKVNLCTPNCLPGRLKKGTQRNWDVGKLKEKSFLMACRGFDWTGIRMICVLFLYLFLFFLNHCGGEQDSWLQGNGSHSMSSSNWSETKWVPLLFFIATSLSTPIPFVSPLSPALPSLYSPLEILWRSGHLLILRPHKRFHPAARHVCSR